MPINFRVSALVPVGLIVESIAQLDDTILVTARAGIGDTSSVHRLRGVFTAGMFVKFRTCLAQVGAYGRDPPVLLRHSALPETDLRRTL